MKTPTSIVATSILASLVLVSCQSNTAQVKPPATLVAKVDPLPSWTKQAGKKGDSTSSRKVKISSKIIEITREPGSPGLPSGLSQKKLNSAAFQSYLRKISQQKGADLMTSPSVVSFEGQVAKVEIGREFVYPDPVQADPLQPIKFLKELTGVTQFYRARSYDGGKTYRLNILTQVKEFIRFQKLPDGTEQPVFKTRRVGETVTIAAGETILFSGLVTDTEQRVEDKVPFLGDIPFLGRAFTKKSTLTFQKELILAVTADRVR
jgi:type II secretory pathway component GspD/PulD (secretin)